MAEITIDLSEQQMAIIDHFANAMGMTREEAGYHFLLNDALGWYEKVMVPLERNQRLYEHPEQEDEIPY